MVRSCIYNGKDYKSLKGLARDLGISYKLLYDRTKYENMSIEDAVNKALHDKKVKEERALRKSLEPKKVVVPREFRFPLEYEGNTFYTMQELADYYSLNCHTLASRLNKGATIEDAIAPPMNALNFPRTYKGVIYTTITSLAKAYGISWSMLYNRLKDGLPLEEALKKENRNINQEYKNIVVHGKPYNSLNALATEFGVSRNTIVARLERGFSYEESVVKGKLI